eukprot:403353201
MEEYLNKKNMDPALFFQGLDILDQKFRNKFLDKHRNLKSMIHLCQHQAYSHPGLAYAESEDRARQCFLPLMLVRRHASVMMENAKGEFAECMSKLEAEAASLNGGISPEKAGIYQNGLDKGRQECLQGYKHNLKKQIPIVHSYYDGYIMNYNLKDGSLIKVIKDEQQVQKQAATNKSQKKDTENKSDVL